MDGIQLIRIIKDDGDPNRIGLMVLAQVQDRGRNATTLVDNCVYFNDAFEMIDLKNLNEDILKLLKTVEYYGFGIKYGETTNAMLNEVPDEDIDFSPPMYPHKNPDGSIEMRYNTVRWAGKTARNTLLEVDPKNPKLKEFGFIK